MSEQSTADPTEIVKESAAKVVVVMPARQAAATLRETVSEIPLDHVAEIILVDDSSTDETVEKLLRAVLGHLGPNARRTRGVVLQDYVKRRRTEVDGLTGVVVEKGRQVNVPTPANAAIAHVNHQIRIGALKPDRSNLAIAEAMLGSVVSTA